MTGPLTGLRIAVTRPPHTWFGGVDFDFAVEMAEGLRALGALVFEVETDGFAWRNKRHIERSIDALRSFRPDVAVSLPNALYLLLCRTVTNENVFRDILEVPSIMLWDHGLFQLPKSALHPLPDTPGGSESGAIAR